MTVSSKMMVMTAVTATSPAACRPCRRRLTRDKRSMRLRSTVGTTNAAKRVMQEAN